jgi:hypothetical protein
MLLAKVDAAVMEDGDYGDVLTDLSDTVLSQHRRGQISFRRRSQVVNGPFHFHSHHKRVGNGLDTAPSARRFHSIDCQYRRLCRQYLLRGRRLVLLNLIHNRSIAARVGPARLALALA